MKRKLGKVFILILAIIIGGSYIYDLKTRKLNNSAPEVRVVYKGEKISTEKGEYLWTGNLPKGQKAGNNNLVGPSYEVGEGMEGVSAKALEEIEVNFESNPHKMSLNIWKSGEAEVYLKEEYDSKEDYKIKLPSEKGEFVFEVRGNWNENNYTSDIFKLKIE